MHEALCTTLYAVCSASWLAIFNVTKPEVTDQQNAVQGCAKKVLAMFGEGNFGKADELCYSGPRLVGSRREENSNMQELFRKAL